jgi:hypothetical protein
VNVKNYPFTFCTGFEGSKYLSDIPQQLFPTLIQVMSLRKFFHFPPLPDYTAAARKFVFCGLYGLFG